MNRESDDLIACLKAQALETRRFLVDHSVHHDTHLGGALSATDILTALYFHFMRVRPQDPDWEDRDNFILSKGHVGIALYYLLAKRGFFPVQDLKTYEQIGTIFGTHPSNKIPGVEMTTGSLGHGLSVGAGMAIVGKKDARSYRVYVMLGDGELQEGSVWEAAMAASSHKLDNLVAIVDRNRFQSGEMTEKILTLEPIDQKFRAFGWSATVIDGNDMEQIVQTLSALPFEKDKPSVIIANTIKGKGVSFIENKAESHLLILSEAQAQQALEPLETGP